MAGRAASCYGQGTFLPRGYVIRLTREFITQRG